MDNGCAKMVRREGSWRNAPCARAGVVQEDGKLWCRQHSPSATKKRDEKNAQVRAEHMKYKGRRRRAIGWKAAIEALEKAGHAEYVMAADYLRELGDYEV